MKTATLFLFFTFFISSFLMAQNPNGGGGNQPKPNPKGQPKPNPLINNLPKGKGKIMGVILDANTKAPVEFASTALIDASTGKVINGATTNDKGIFIIDQLPIGNYKISISFIGYQTITKDSIQLTDQKPEIRMGTIALPQETKLLKEVSVEGQKDLVEDKIDRIVYNAEKDVTNAGGTAEDVLRKVPMLSVDLDGNVQLRGSGNIRVLVNGKPSTILASNVADAIRQIPADMIKTVEVITSPSAKYDAEGTGGIINIILKRNDLQGISGMINPSFGTRVSVLSGNLTARKNKFGVNVNGMGRVMYMPFDGTNKRENITTTERSYINQNNQGKNFGIFGGWQLGMDYEISPKNTLAGSFRFGQRFFDVNNTLNTNYSNSQNAILQQFTRTITSRDYANSYDFTLDYTHTFQKPQQELTILALHSITDGLNRYNLDQINTKEVVDYKEKNENPNVNKETTVQIDYAHPLQEGTTIEVGGKSIFRHVYSQFDLSKYNFTNSIFEIDPNRSNQFDYDQNVGASYLSFTHNTKSKFGFKAGVRYEITEIAGNFKVGNTNFTQSYSNILPSITLSKEVKQGHKIKLSYNQRIQRPSIQFLNPYKNFSDSKNVSYGNPNLSPELTHNYELSYSAFIKNVSLNLSVYFRNTNNAITTIRTIDQGGIMNATFDNIGQNNTYGLSLFGGGNIFSWWQLNGSANLMYAMYKSPEYNASIENYMYNVHLNSSLIFGKGYSFQIFAFFNSPRVELQGRQGAFSFYTMGFKKELFNKKGGLTLGIDNIFSNTLAIRSDFSSPSFNTESVRYMYNRAFRLSFNYQFGKMTGGGKKKKGINNDDLKEGEDNGGGAR